MSSMSLFSRTYTQQTALLFEMFLQMDVSRIWRKFIHRSMCYYKQFIRDSTGSVLASKISDVVSILG